MSTKIKNNLVGTALVAALFACGSLFGYTALGGSQQAPAEAVVPQESTSCIVCGSGFSGGGGGNVPAPQPPSGITGGGNGGTINPAP